jgi:hypothetical protein
MTASIEILQILEKQEPTNFAGIITGDESWFVLDCSRNHTWRLGDENSPERISQKIGTEKDMSIIFRSARGPLVEDWLPMH